MRLVVLVVAVFVAVNGKSFFRMRGLDKSDEWFGPLKALSSAIITETLDLGAIKDKVEGAIDACMQEDETTGCLKGKVDSLAEFFGAELTAEELNKAKETVEFLSEFLGAVYRNCRDAGEGEIGECAMATGKEFCSKAGDRKSECEEGVKKVLAKAQEMASKDGKRGLDREDEWFDALSALGTKIISETFDLEAVKDKVKASVEECMQEDDTTQCLKKKVDMVSDAEGVPKAEREDAKEKIGFLSDFLREVYTNCNAVPEEEIGDCAKQTGDEFCSGAGDRKEDCMNGVFYILGKAKEMHEQATQEKKRGLGRHAGSWIRH